jgi:UDP-N-acetylmuramate dehydrogenase
MIIQNNIDLKPFNTFGLNAKTKYFTEVAYEEDVEELFQSAVYSNEPKFILGGGSNILFTKPFDGLTVKINFKGIHLLEEDDEQLVIRVGAGENWHNLVLYCVNRGWGGLENLSLIPGTVGAAPMQNIGAYGVEQNSSFVGLQAFELDTGKFKSFDADACHFGYRTSIFKTSHKHQFLITSVDYRLQKQPVINTSYGVIQETLQAMGHTHPTIKEVSQAIIHIRTSKLPDPDLIGNAGSFFKNPIISTTQYEAIAADYQKIPYYPAGDGKVKLPAAWLIDQCGWKGYRKGDIGVHKNQALVLVNYGNGTGSAIYDLSEEIKQSVKERFKIDLEREVNIL